MNCFNIPEHLVNAVISSVAIITGTILGSLFSWFITKKSIHKNVEFQRKLVEDNRRYEENKKEQRTCELACIIRLDICNSMFQSIRTLKGGSDGVTLFPIPMDTNYSSIVVYLKNELDLKQMSSIYQLYGIIEKLNNDIKKFAYFNEDNLVLVRKDCELLLKKMYGTNIKKLMDLPIEEISYKELYDCEFIKSEYREVLKRLDEICDNDKTSGVE